MPNFKPTRSTTNVPRDGVFPRFSPSHVFLRFAPVACFPALGVDCMFSRSGRVARFPALYACCMLPTRETRVACYVILVLIALYTSVYYDWPVSEQPVLTSKIQTNFIIIHAVFELYFRGAS